MVRGLFVVFESWRFIFPVFLCTSYIFFFFLSCHSIILPKYYLVQSTKFVAWSIRTTENSENILITKPFHILSATIFFLEMNLLYKDFENRVVVMRAWCKLVVACFEQDTSSFVLVKFSKCNCLLRVWMRELTNCFFCHYAEAEC